MRAVTYFISKGRSLLAPNAAKTRKILFTADSPTRVELEVDQELFRKNQYLIECDEEGNHRKPQRTKPIAASYTRYNNLQTHHREVAQTAPAPTKRRSAE